MKAELNDKYTMNKTESKLMPFIKATTLEEKVRIINAWEIDRGGESEECIYDLEDEEDRKLFENMYGVHALAIRRLKNRFWMAGNAFYCDVAEKRMNNSHEVYAVTLANIDKMFEIFVSCIEDRAEEHLASNMGDKAVTARDMTLYYPFDIDFKGYFGLEQKFRWVACSTDGSFEDESKETFTSIEDAYLNMRNAVLEKMKWNTEFGDMEGNERLSVGYKLHFGTKEITHDSYSGFYIYRIVDDGWEKENLIDLIKKAYSEGAVAINPLIPILTSTRSKSAVLKADVYNEIFFDNGKEYFLNDLTTYDLLLLYGDMVCHTEEQHLF